MLFILGPWSLHPVSEAPAVPCACLDGVWTSLVIVEFYPCAVSSDEYLVLSNRAAETVNLLGWTVTDGEGVLTFSQRLLAPGEELSVSENASSYSSAYGEAPDIHLPGWSSGDGAEVSGTFRLADSGDVISVSTPDGSVSDSVAYGEAPAPDASWLGGPVPPLRQGEVARRLTPDGPTDTDSAEDWMPFRESRYGHTDHGVFSSYVAPGLLTSFTSPDCSLDVVMDVLSGAETSIRLCAYELSSSPVCLLLSDARSRGVDVRVLVDALPAGGMSAAQVSCISRLASDGVDVRVLGGNMDAGIVRHFGALHAKYVVVDGSTLVALSENFVEDGVPADRLFGNRGWGVSVEDRGLASFMAQVFDDDSRLERADVWAWLDDPRCEPGAVIPDSEPIVHPVGMLPPAKNLLGAEVSLYVSPDVSEERPFIVPLISASRDVVFEQFQAEPEWSARWSSVPVANPVLDAVGDVLDSGGTARGVFDASWYNLEDNSAAVSFLCARASASCAQPSFALLDDASPIASMHNKGLVLDQSIVISSNNWVYSSFAKNRELAVVVRSEESSSHFRAAFDLDFVPDRSSPVANAGPDVQLPAPGEIVLDASGSWDDRALAEVSWDFNGDGWADATGARVSFSAASIGTYTVQLAVEDAWGNTASDSVTVTVGAGPAPEESEGPAVLRVPWALPGCASVLAVAVLVARKLNLLPPTTRGKG